MKILHLISSGGMYGAEAVILDLSRCLRETGHESSIATFVNLLQPNTQLENRALADGVKVFPLPCRGQLDSSVPFRLRELIAAERIDVVHAHGYKADVYAYWSLRNASVPIVSTCHTWYDNDVALRVYGILDRYVLRRFEAVVSVSEEVRGRLLGAGVRDGRIRLIRNGVDLRPFQARRGSAASGVEAPLRVGLVGRLSREKGVDLFIRAAAVVLQSFPDTEFVVIGEGPDRPELEGLIEELGVGDHVVLHGRDDDMPGVYASLDLQVSASRQEGLPIALLEGMASGLPVVAARVGEVPTVVRDEVTGLLVDRENVQALAAAIAELLVDGPRRCRMGAAAKARVAAEFSADRMTAEYLEVYEAALHERAR